MVKKDQEKNISALGRLIKRQLELLDMTQGALAAEMEVADNAVSKWLYGGGVARSNLARLAGVLKLSVDDLLNPGVALGQTPGRPEFKTKRQREIDAINSMLERTSDDGISQAVGAVRTIAGLFPKIAQETPLSSR